MRCNVMKNIVQLREIKLLVILCFEGEDLGRIDRNMFSALFKNQYFVCFMHSPFVISWPGVRLSPPAPIYQ